MTSQYLNIEKQAGWSLVLDNIGGIQRPDYSNFVQNSAGIYLYNIGKNCNTMAAKEAIPIPPNTGHVIKTWQFKIDPLAAIYQTNLEFDTIFSIGGLLYNCSTRYSHQAGDYQTIDKNWNWQNIEMNPPVFQPDVWNTARATYILDGAGKTSSIPEISINGKDIKTPANLLAVPAQAPTGGPWTQNVFNDQIEIDLNTLGGGAGMYVRDIDYIFS